MKINRMYICVALMSTPFFSVSAQTGMEDADTTFSPQREAVKIDAQQSFVERMKHAPLGAFTTSALVPGAGELINGSNNGFAFLGVEVGLWVGYIVIHVLRNNNIDAYQKNVSTGWDRAQYDDYKATFEGDAVEDPQSLFFSIEEVPEEGSHAYYRFITTPQAAPGWEDYETYYNEELPAFKEEFRTPVQRDMSGLFDTAEHQRAYKEYTLSAVMLNHIISAIDAYRVARLRLEHQRISFHIQVKDASHSSVPHAVLVYRF